MDLAVKYKAKKCWLFEEFQGDPPEGFGWPKELNGYERKH
jgi:hypothetical protein